MAAIKKGYILLLALRTIIKKTKKRKLQRNNKMRHWVCPMNLQGGNMIILLPFYIYKR